MAYIHDGIALHTVGNPQPAGTAGGLRGRGAVSLHLYCPPIKRVRLYEGGEEGASSGEGSGGRVVQRTPAFFSRGGVRAELDEAHNMYYI